MNWSRGNSPLSMPQMSPSDMFLPGLGGLSPMQISPPDNLEFRGFMQGVNTQPATFQPSQFKSPAPRRKDELPELHSPRTMQQLSQPTLRSSPEANFSPGGLSPMQISPSAFPMIPPPQQTYVQPRTFQPSINIQAPTFQTTTVEGPRKSQRISQRRK